MDREDAHDEGVARPRRGEVGLLPRFLDPSLEQRREAAQGEHAEGRRLPRECYHLLQVRDLGLAAAGAGEGGEHARLVVEPLDERGDAVARAPVVKGVEQA